MAKLEVLSESGLALEPVDGPAVAGEVVGQQLDGNGTIRDRVVREVDGAHAAVAEAAKHAVAAEVARLRVVTVMTRHGSWLPDRRRGVHGASPQG
jgi:hypothetical protein